MSALHNDPAEKERRDLFNKAIGRIGKAWEAGGVEWALEQGHSAPYEPLSKVWIACQHDMATLGQFKAALGEWEAANQRKIEELKEKAKNATNTLHQTGLFH